MVDGAAHATPDALNYLAMNALLELREIAGAITVLERIRDELIVDALAADHSEREVGRAANMSGPAINQRKKRRAEGTD